MLILYCLCVCIRSLYDGFIGYVFVHVVWYVIAIDFLNGVVYVEWPCTVLLLTVLLFSLVLHVLVLMTMLVHKGLKCLYVALNVVPKQLDFAVNNRITVRIKYVHVRIVVGKIWIVDDNIVVIRVTQHQIVVLVLGQNGFVATDAPEMRQKPRQEITRCCMGRFSCLQVATCCTGRDSARLVGRTQ